MHIYFLNKRLHLNGMESNLDWELNVNDFCYKNIAIMPFILYIKKGYSHSLKKRGGGIMRTSLKLHKSTFHSLIPPNLGGIKKWVQEGY